MPVNKELYYQLSEQLKEEHVTLVAVSKTKTVSDILELYELGQRDFGENYVQEMVEKHEQLPHDIRWHFIGHLQTNKVKYIIPFVHLIHGVDSLRLLKEVDRQAAKAGKIQTVLLQMHIATEATKFGLDEAELNDLLNDPTIPTLKQIKISGLMGMASFTNDTGQVAKEFSRLRAIFDHFEERESFNCRFSTLSMGMSADYEIAIAEGSNLVRIGSLLFGER